MGLQIGDIVPRKDIRISDLKRKTIVVDASNIIYQFLSTIRQPDGTPLMDKKGRVTSHLSGLFYRNVNLLLEGINLIYVFDGKPPELKFKTNEKRRESKDIAREKYESAKKKKDIAEMRRYAQQLTKLGPEQIKESKELLEAMGIAVIQAPSEAEAQASYLCKHDKEIYAVASQDYDSLAFGTPILLQNLTFATKRKTSSGFVFISPQIIELEKVFNTLQISQDQLISLAILTGTDYNPGGIYGIGPKKALNLVRAYKQPALIFKQVEKQLEEDGKKLDFDWKEIFELFKKHPVIENPSIIPPKLNEDKIKNILLEHDFSEDRVENQLKKLRDLKELKKQKGLKDFF